MRRLLNCLYVFSEDAFLTLDGGNVVAKCSEKEIGRLPLHTLESILSFSYAGASPSLMGACADRGIGLSFFSTRGRFLAGVHGRQRGNVLLRKRQYSISENEEECLPIAKSFINGKLYNSRWVLERATRDHGLRIDTQLVKDASKKLHSSINQLRNCSSAASIRGIEGEAATSYFGVFDQMILRNKEDFSFNLRTKRPPTDPVNAMLSLFYTVLAQDCASALEGVGLDPYVGFLHTDRPGRASLALDLMEELRSVLVDRFILSSINNRMVSGKHFETRETGEVRITDEGRKILFSSWQDKKKEIILHPFLKEKIPRGLVPHVQALLLSRYLRGDLDGYPPFFWK